MKERNALVAGVFNLVSPGLGFLYLGRPRWAFAMLLGLSLVWAAGAWSRIILAPLGFAAVGLVLLGAWLAAIVAAVRIARRASPAPPRAWQRWYVYLAFFAGSALFHHLLIENRDRLFGYETFRFPSMSMLQTLVWGDYFVCDTWHFQGGGPQRGELVVFRYPADPSLKHVKRVIGLPGETLQISDGAVRVDGRPIEEPYVLPVNNRLFPGDSSATVPPASYFVMGDNRDNSFDSRMWGAVPQENLLGSVEFIWFSFTWKDGLRVERIGTRPN